LAHIDRLRTAGLEIAGVVADAAHGRVAPLRRALDDWGLRYALAVRGDHVVWTPHAKDSPLAGMLATLPSRTSRSSTNADGVSGRHNTAAPLS